MNLGLNLSTSISTNYGNFNLKAGGVSWYRQSRLTIWGNRSFNRISIFERRPQTPLNKIPIDRYSNYYDSGLIDQGIRYGSRAFQGIFLNASKLPLNFSVKELLEKVILIALHLNQMIILLDLSNSKIHLLLIIKFVIITCLHGLKLTL